MPEILFKACEPVANGAANFGEPRPATSDAEAFQGSRAHAEKVGSAAGVEYGGELSAAGFFCGFRGHGAILR